MSNTTEFKFSQVSGLVQAAFPGAKSRRPVRVEVRESYHVQNYWDGGTRYECAAINAKTKLPVSLEQAGFQMQTQGNPYGLQSGLLKLTQEFIVVEHVFFCGKDLGYRIYAHPSVNVVSGS